MKNKQKIGNKLIILMLTCFILISSIWAGSTFAYFSASKGASGTITMGTLKIDKLSKTDNTDIDWNISNVVPNQEFGGSYKAVVNSDINYYTRILFKASVSAQTGKTHDTTCADYKADPTDILNIQVGQTGTNSYTKSSTKTEDGYTVYYKLSPTTPTASTTDETFDIGLRVYNWVGNGGCDYYMGATININMQVEVIQADYLESQNKGTTFTDVNTMHTLWEKCVPDKTTESLTKYKVNVNVSGCSWAYAINNANKFTDMGTSNSSTPIETNKILFMCYFPTYDNKKVNVANYTPNWNMTVGKTEADGYDLDPYIYPIVVFMDSSYTPYTAESYMAEHREGNGNGVIVYVILDITKDITINIEGEAYYP